MSFLAGLTVYTFAAITFIRRIDGDDFPPWFNADPSYTKDIVLGGTTAYIDLGADVYPPLAFRASCLSAADRLALVAARSSTGTLSNTRGHAGTVTLLKAAPQNSGTYTDWFIDLLFELRP